MFARTFFRMYIRIFFVAIFLSLAWFLYLNIRLTANEDWHSAIEGIKVDGSIAFSGCTRAIFITDEKAFKVAVMKAQANMARARRVVISGSEHSESGSSGGRYKLTIEEKSEAYLRPVIVLDKQMATLDGAMYLCVLVKEGK